MAQHLVKCLYCNEQLDINDPAVEWVKTNKVRYAHKSCADKREALIKEQEAKKKEDEKWKKQLLAYYEHVFHQSPNGGVYEQINKFLKPPYNYTYSGMYKTLYWWYTIKKSDPQKANGRISIIPYIYSDAEKYYYELYLNEKNAEKSVKIIEEQPKEKESVHLTIPKRGQRARLPLLFDLGDDDET